LITFLAGREANFQLSTARRFRFGKRSACPTIAWNSHAMKSTSIVLFVLFAATTSRAAGQETAGTNAEKPSPEVKDTVLRFYQKMRAADMSGFDEFISIDPSLTVVGSAGEWFTQRERLRGVFRLKNAGLEKGTNPVAYENGGIGWFVDQPDWVFPDGSRIHTRFTAILRREQGAWKFVHWHLSVGVPDDEVVALQRRWLAK
jgi:hypothetical protein